MGIVVVAAFAARAVAVPIGTTITVTCRRTRSAAKSARRLLSPCAQRNSPTLDIAGLGKPISERRDVVNTGLGRTWMEKADDRQTCLLRPRRQRPRRRAADQADEGAPR